MSVYAGLDFSVRSVNNTFKIKVFGVNEGVKYNTLVGVSGLINLVGVELANRAISRAFKSLDDKCTVRLRRGLKIDFYYY